MTTILKIEAILGLVAFISYTLYLSDKGGVGLFHDIGETIDSAFFNDGEPLLQSSSITK